MLIKSYANDAFNELECKVDTSITKVDNVFDLSKKLEKSEFQINEILRKYDKLSRNEMDIEDKYLFANYLINIFNKANNVSSVTIYDMGFGIDNKKLIEAVSLLLSYDIHDKVIGIDNFVSLSHESSILLIELIALVNSVVRLDGVQEEIYLNWLYRVDNNVVKKLNEIRNRKGLEPFKYECELSDEEEKIILKALESMTFVDIK